MHKTYTHTRRKGFSKGVFRIGNTLTFNVTVKVKKQQQILKFTTGDFQRKSIFRFLRENPKAIIRK